MSKHKYLWGLLSKIKNANITFKTTKTSRNTFHFPNTDVNSIDYNQYYYESTNSLNEDFDDISNPTYSLYDSKSLQYNGSVDYSSYSDTSYDQDIFNSGFTSDTIMDRETKEDTEAAAIYQPKWTNVSESVVKESSQVKYHERLQRLIDELKNKCMEEQNSQPRFDAGKQL